MTQHSEIELTEIIRQQRTCSNCVHKNVCAVYNATIGIPSSKFILPAHQQNVYAGINKLIGENCFHFENEIKINTMINQTIFFDANEIRYAVKFEDGSITYLYTGKEIKEKLIELNPQIDQNSKLTNPFLYSHTKKWYNEII